MRTILFRGKQRVTRDWFEGYYEVIQGHHYVDNMIIDPETLGQYTGLDDRNGIKIFEGDILSYTYIGKPYGCRKEREIKIMGKVAFHNEDGGFSIENIVENRMHYHIVAIQGWEVIGNIHDNPELLEAQDD
jgi:uncharacterized phage protein (TIGR01671 family)